MLGGGRALVTAGPPHPSGSGLTEHSRIAEALEPRGIEVDELSIIQDLHGHRFRREQLLQSIELENEPRVVHDLQQPVDVAGTPGFDFSEQTLDIAADAGRQRISGHPGLCTGDVFRPELHPLHGSE